MGGGGGGGTRRSRGEGAVGKELVGGSRVKVLGKLTEACARKTGRKESKPRAERVWGKGGGFVLTNR